PGAEPPYSNPVTPTAGGAKVGLIDGGVDTSHAVFRDIVIHQHGCAGTPVPAAHGTAVASLMIGQSPRFHGAAPGSELYAADVYCGLATGGAVDAVVDALAWLVRERVPVINVSLVGPPNSMLENVVCLLRLLGMTGRRRRLCTPRLIPMSWVSLLLTRINARCWRRAGASR